MSDVLSDKQVEYICEWAANGNEYRDIRDLPVWVLELVVADDRGMKLTSVSLTIARLRESEKQTRRVTQKVLEEVKKQLQQLPATSKEVVEKGKYQTFFHVKKNGFLAIDIHEIGYNKFYEVEIQYLDELYLYHLLNNRIERWVPVAGLSKAPCECLVRYERTWGEYYVVYPKSRPFSPSDTHYLPIPSFNAKLK